MLSLIACLHTNLNTVDSDFHRYLCGLFQTPCTSPSSMEVSSLPTSVFKLIAKIWCCDLTAVCDQFLSHTRSRLLVTVGRYCCNCKQQKTRRALSGMLGALSDSLGALSVGLGALIVRQFRGSVKQVRGSVRQFASRQCSHCSGLAFSGFSAGWACTSLAQLLGEPARHWLSCWVGLHVTGSAAG